MWKYGGNDYELILVGEKHGVRENFDEYLKLIKKFNSYDNINVYFEISISAGIYIDEYINGREIFSINEFIEDFKGTMLGTSDFKDFVVSLKKYNKRAKRKINFYGIDLEFQKRIAEKMKEYLLKDTDETLYNRIISNQENTVKIDNLDDRDFEIKREETLFQNLLEIYQPNSICYMGAWHTRNSNYDENFAKKVQSKNIRALSVELLYQNSKRTIKTDKGFEVVKVNDVFDRTMYKKYGKIYIMKNDWCQGIIALKNCKSTKMI